MSFLSSIRRFIARPRAVSPFFCCPVCGGEAFEKSRVLWSGLVQQWELSPEERDHIDTQQGMVCLRCNSTLRSMTLADAMLSFWRSSLPFERFCREEAAFAGAKLLEVNTAGQLSSLLARLPNHTLATYPEVDMQAMKYEDNTFDVIVHSDTLEHVPDPLQALRECHRVLKIGGAMFYTVPVVFGRLSRRRDDLPPSYHGSILRRTGDYRVVTEYGFDFFLQPYEAGFRGVSMHSLLFPESAALICRKVVPI